MAGESPQSPLVPFNPTTGTREHLSGTPDFAEPTPPTGLSRPRLNVLWELKVPEWKAAPLRRAEKPGDPPVKPRLEPATLLLSLSERGGKCPGPVRTRAKSTRRSLPRWALFLAWKVSPRPPAASPPRGWSFNGPAPWVSVHTHPPYARGSGGKLQSRADCLPRKENSWAKVPSGEKERWGQG